MAGFDITVETPSGPVVPGAEDFERNIEDIKYIITALTSNVFTIPKKPVGGASCCACCSPSGCAAA